MKMSFPASLDSLYEMLVFIKEHAEAEGFDLEGILQIELAAEEALVNIINYGYSASDAGEIEIECFPTKKNSHRGLRIVLRDCGKPYNPLINVKIKEMREMRSLENCEEGGFGIFFILKIMDEVEYKRDVEHNILTLVKFY